MRRDELERMAEGIVRLRLEILRRRIEEGGLPADELTTPQAIALRTVVRDGPLRVGNLAGAVPFTQSGIGPYEVAVAQLLARRGETLDLGTAYAVGAHALVLLTSLISGGVALLLLRLRPGEVFYLHGGGALSLAP